MVDAFIFEDELSNAWTSRYDFTGNNIRVVLDKDRRQPSGQPKPQPLSPVVLIDFEFHSKDDTCLTFSLISVFLSHPSISLAEYKLVTSIESLRVLTPKLSISYQ